MKLKNAVQDWLDDYGYALGYSWDNLPTMKDFSVVATNSIRAFEYNGHESERSYYSNDG